MELQFTASAREHSGKLGEIGLKQTQVSAWLVANIWKSCLWEATEVNDISRFTRGSDTSVNSRLMRWYSGACAGTSH